jgi:hypothetical protein
MKSLRLEFRHQQQSFQYTSLDVLAITQMICFSFPRRLSRNVCLGLRQSRLVAIMSFVICAGCFEGDGLRQRI